MVIFGYFFHLSADFVSVFVFINLTPSFSSVSCDLLIVSFFCDVRCQKLRVLKNCSFFLPLWHNSFRDGRLKLTFQFKALHFLNFFSLSLVVSPTFRYIFFCIGFSSVLFVFPKLCRPVVFFSFLMSYVSCCFLSAVSGTSLSFVLKNLSRTFLKVNYVENSEKSNPALKSRKSEPFSTSINSSHCSSVASLFSYQIVSLKWSPGSLYLFLFGWLYRLYRFISLSVFISLLFCLVLQSCYLMFCFGTFYPKEVLFYFVFYYFLFFVLDCFFSN